MDWKKLFFKKKMLIQDLEYYKRTNRELENTIAELRAENLEKHNALDRLRKEINKLECVEHDNQCLIEKHNQELEDLNNQYKDLFDTANKEYAENIEKYKDIAAKEIENSASTIETSKALAGIIASQQSSIAALAQGIYNQEHIEFFALKTYRGWKYICVNGQKITDFNNVNTINLSWNKNDSRLKVDIK